MIRIITIFFFFLEQTITTLNHDQAHLMCIQIEKSDCLNRNKHKCLPESKLFFSYMRIE